MAWLSGYSKRIKVTADHTKVGSNLSWFPLTIFLKSGNGDTSKVITALGSNNLKMAVTKSDGTTQLYVEIEKWDTTNSIGVLHCGLNGDTLSSSTNTDYYIYYDNNHADNTTYVGVKNSTPAQSVWDSYCKFISHQDDGADTSHIYDSTSNNNDGTKVSAGNPAVNTSGIVDSDQLYNNDDYVNHGTSTTLNPDSHFSISAYVKLTDNSSLYRGIVTTTKAETNRHNWWLGINTDRKAYFGCYTGSGSTSFTVISNNSIYNANHHIMCTYDGTTIKMYVDGSLQTQTATGTMSVASGYGLEHGRFYVGYNDYYWVGDIDEIRYSVGITRSADWAKAEYNSLTDTLLTYGTEEKSPANFFPFF